MTKFEANRFLIFGFLLTSFRCIKYIINKLKLWKLTPNDKGGAFTDMKAYALTFKSPYILWYS